MANLEQTTLSGGPSPWIKAAVAGLESMKRALSDWRRRSAFRQEIAQLERAGLLDVVLDDLGMTRWEMDKVARGYPEAERLLPNMAERRGVTLQALDAHTLFALRHTCAVCNAHRACRRWMARGATGEAAFCPNSDLLDTLAAQQRLGD